jgi:hypothetical protein
LICKKCGGNLGICNCQQFNVGDVVRIKQSLVDFYKTQDYKAGNVEYFGLIEDVCMSNINSFKVRSIGFGGKSLTVEPFNNSLVNYLDHTYPCTLFEEMEK